MKAEIITIGDEILYGQTVDTNSAWLGTQLNAMGIEVSEILTVSDRRDAILDALKRGGSRADLILTTGGLGPTNDDISKKTLAEYFGVGLKRNKEIEEQVKALLRRWKREAEPVHLGQADLPENCEALPNPLGTAPGMLFHEKGKIFVSLPGVPHEMKAIFRNELAPRLQKLWKLPAIRHYFIMTAGMGESDIASRLQEFEAGLPENVKLAYLPSLGMVKLRLTARGSNDDKLDTILKKLASDLIRLLPDVVFYSGTNGEMSISKAVGQLLLENKAHLATAESCTGGKIAADIVSIAGASHYFAGSVVAYSNQVKMKVLGVRPETLKAHGAVSEQTVKEMAEGVCKLMVTEYAIAVSGIAGPEGGTPEKPVGTVWTAIASPEGVQTKLLHLSGGRLEIIQLTSNLTLNLLRKSIKRNEQRG